ncbi:MAG TPA: hypothetical protein VFF02_06215, partial [Anaeromyxobacteraceae bacterium]|nr:hypothetical protein [Anaeromyxobacteraceae bacterium]
MAEFEYDPLSFLLGQPEEAAAMSRARSRALRQREDIGAIGAMTGDPALSRAAELLSRGATEAEGQMGTL